MLWEVTLILRVETVSGKIESKNREIENDSFIGMGCGHPPKPSKPPPRAGCAGTAPAVANRR